MPYHPWLQFLRQKSSLFAQEYSTRAPSHSRWLDFNIYLPQDAAVLSSVEPWMQISPQGLQIQLTGTPRDLLDAIESYGAILEGCLSHLPPAVRPSAVGAVVYDTRRDRIYYGVSGFFASMSRMMVHTGLMTREQSLPLVLPHQMRTLVGSRSPRTCSEFKALNRALLDGAQEHDLHVWTFRVRDMRPIPQCPNCRVTVSRSQLGRIWTA